MAPRAAKHPSETTDVPDAAKVQESSTPATSEVADAQADTETPAPKADLLAQTILNGPVFTGSLSHDEYSRLSRGSAIGRLSADAVYNCVRRFVEPSDYRKALEALVSERIVLLEGDVGVGKQTSAIALLSELCSSLVELSPAVTLPELGERTYHEQHGYLVIDYALNSSEVDSEFWYRRICEAMQSSDAYMVITTSQEARTSRRIPARRFGWQQPELSKVLKLYTGDPKLSTDVVDQIRQAAAEPLTMRSLTKIASQVAQNEPLERILGEYSGAAKLAVSEWFQETNPERRDIADVTTLCFAHGANERRFETLRIDLERKLRLEVDGLTTTTIAKSNDEYIEQPLRADRLRRAAESSLMQVELDASSGRPQRRVLFKNSRYQHTVLLELWTRYETPFWNAVKAWLDEAVSEKENIGDIAVGLAILAQIDSYEVAELFLKPWSDGDRGWNGQVAAASILGSMCESELSARFAVREAVSWCTTGRPEQRWTGALAFCGELGLSFPAVAVRRLWHLMTSSDEMARPCQVALASLFSTFVSEGSDAGVLLLRRLERQVDKFGLRSGYHGNVKLLAHTINLISELLNSHDLKSGTPSLLQLADRAPHHIPLIAKLLSFGLRYRSARRRIIVQMRDQIIEFLKHSDTAEETSRALGHSLTQHLSPAEQLSLQRDFETVQAASQSGLAEELVAVLVQCFHPNSDAVSGESPPSTKKES